MNRAALLPPATERARGSGAGFQNGQARASGWREVNAHLRRSQAEQRPSYLPLLHSFNPLATFRLYDRLSRKGRLSKGWVFRFCFGVLRAGRSVQDMHANPGLFHYDFHTNIGTLARVSPPLGNCLWQAIASPGNELFRTAVRKSMCGI